jgi:hypothetical protein
MAVSISGTTLTFNDSTTMTTAPTGTVSSVATGNGLSGGTITTTGTLVVACPTFNTVGSYIWGVILIQNGDTYTVTSGSNYSAGSGNRQLCSTFNATSGRTNNLSGTWKNMGGTATFSPCGGDTYIQAIYCRVS